MSEKTKERALGLYGRLLHTQEIGNRKPEKMSLCPPYAPFFGFAGVAASVSRPGFAQYRRRVSLI